MWRARATYLTWWKDGHVKPGVLISELYAVLGLHWARASWHTPATVGFCCFSAWTNGKRLRLTAVQCGQVLDFTTCCV